MEKLPEINIIGNKNLVPLDEKISYTGIGFIFEEEIEICTNLFNFLAQATLNECDFGFIDVNINDSDLLTLKSGVEQSDIFIFIFIPSKNNVIDNAKILKIKKIINDLTSEKPFIFILNNNSVVLNELKPDLYYILPDCSFPTLVSCIVSISGRNLENN